MTAVGRGMGGILGSVTQALVRESAQGMYGDRVFQFVKQYTEAVDDKGCIMKTSVRQDEQGARTA